MSQIPSLRFAASLPWSSASAKRKNYIASDMGAIRAETDKVYVIDDDELCRISRDSVEITDLDLKPIQP